PSPCRNTYSLRARKSELPTNREGDTAPSFGMVNPAPVVVYAFLPFAPAAATEPSAPGGPGILETRTLPSGWQHLRNSGSVPDMTNQWNNQEHKSITRFWPVV